ncbi:PE-PGRS family protein [Mycobacterium tuberculosis]|nr:PE-PGRS family protein [Mycobacterium tuberculosis]CEZ30409.1 PE-PGRS family protein [Mycobacterium tuberculosis]CEZ71528.1 PE-PGRS family protein [Mycobacterium tuberculosis]CFA26014.1 PE-PGRS family protein [Mycobacterium tuberculosis]CFA97779.1 PE-PGRS family protein [Mycobacterium tuberculosis]
MAGPVGLAAAAQTAGSVVVVPRVPMPPPRASVARTVVKAATVGSAGPAATPSHPVPTAAMAATAAILASAALAGSGGSAVTA